MGVLILVENDICFSNANRARGTLGCGFDFLLQNLILYNPAVLITTKILIWVDFLWAVSEPLTFYVLWPHDVDGELVGSSRPQVPPKRDTTNQGEKAEIKCRMSNIQESVIKSRIS